MTVRCGFKKAGPSIQSRTRSRNVRGDVGWRLLARRNGLTQRALRARPLDEPERSG